MLTIYYNSCEPVLQSYKIVRLTVETRLPLQRQVWNDKSIP